MVLWPRLWCPDQPQGVRLVREAGDRAAEGVSGAAPRKREERGSGLARVDVGSAGGLASRVVPRRAHNQIREAVVIDVAHARSVLTELVAFANHSNAWSASPFAAYATPTL